MSAARWNPVTNASHRQVTALATAIAERHAEHYGTVPRSYLALSVREVVRFCEDAGIWEPVDIACIVEAMISPSPALLPQADRDHALHVIGNDTASPEARARSVSLALRGTAPPPREPSGAR
ncbi:hypothetical protein [Jannaschia sp. LMIT008]|uniref:hypothetical protein n=1 Tax=Jannaschia maritima TaxID=3032585 RepID=UPI00281259BA|nr:hypothetical protein [Jannaschia sp. LMIT008]